MRKIYVDCGSFKGKSIKQFRALFGGDYEIFAFDPFVVREYAGMTFFKKAVWVEDCKMPLYVNTKKRNAGSSLFKEKITGKLNKDNPVEVECVDFSRWIRDNFDPTDYIVLKMNIEGSEYPVLNKMIEDGTIDYIDRLYLSFHYEKIGLSKEEHDKLVSALKALKTTTVYHSLMNEKESLL